MAAIMWRVDELAEKRGWSARRLADEAGLDLKTVRNILTKRATRVDLETIAKLSEALRVQPGSLWRTKQDRLEAWRAAAGSAGRASDEEIQAIMEGRWWDEIPEPGLERALRDLDL